MAAGMTLATLQDLLPSAKVVAIQATQANLRTELTGNNANRGDHEPFDRCTSEFFT